MKKVLVINGPNLNLLEQGKRRHGAATLSTLRHSGERAQALGMDVDFIQTNYEGEIIGKIHEARGKYDAIILNPGAYTHYSLAIQSRQGSGIAVSKFICQYLCKEEFRANDCACMQAIRVWGLTVIYWRCMRHHLCWISQKSTQLYKKRRYNLYDYSRRFQKRSYIWNLMARCTR